MRPTRRLIALLASTLLHAAVVAPGLIAADRGELVDADEAPVDVDLSEPGDDEGELPIEPLLDEPFYVSLYVEPAPPPKKAQPVPEPVVSLPMPVPVAPPLPAEEVVAEVAPEPEPEPLPEPPPVEEPLPEPPLSDADRAALAAMERGEATVDAPTDDDDGEAFEVEDERERRAQARAMRRAKARAARDARRPPCPETSESIARVADAAWYIDRDLIEYYASHMAELQKLGSVWTHRNAEGQLDGFRVALARCSVLRQGGLRSGDIVHDINGRRIHSVLQAIGAYIALRAEPELFVRITRKGEQMTLAYTIEQPERRRDKRRAAKKAAAPQAAR